MARRPDSVTFEMPRRPKPIEFAIEEPLHWLDVQLSRTDPAVFMEKVKYMMAARLAHEIVKNTQLFDVPNFSSSHVAQVLRMEFTLNDKGSYVNWLPHEREEGKQEGWRAGYERSRSEIPYGMEPRQFYE